MKREDDQQLWDLLGRSAQPQLSPFFARNIVRRLRQGSTGRFQWFGTWLSPRKLIPVAGLAAAIIAALILTHPLRPAKSVDAVPDFLAKIDPQDYDVVADLDELLATDDTNLWDDDVQTL